MGGGPARPALSGRAVERFEIEFPAAPGRVCSVAFGRDLFVEAARFLSGKKPSAVPIVSDETVAGLYAEKLSEALATEGVSGPTIAFPPGESSKSWETLGSILERLVEAAPGRGAVVAALGGGVTGDLAGAAAALYCRGVEWVQLPTTTLSMADSALGGKTGVNLSGAKNMAGAFHQPAAVFADMETLTSLDARHLRAGLAEVVKTALMLDAELFELLEREAGAFGDPRSRALRAALAVAARLKAEVVARDEREAGERAVLNAGHTLGHAIESASSGALLHGEAVAVGLALESAIAVERAGFPREHRGRLLNVLSALGLPTAPPAGIEAGDVEALLRLDKKNRPGAVDFALPAEVGKPATTESGWTLMLEPGAVAAAMRSLF